MLDPTPPNRTGWARPGVASGYRAAASITTRHRVGNIKPEQSKHLLLQSGTESPAVNIPRMLLNPCYGFRSQNNVKLLSPTSVSDHQYQDQVSGLTFPAMVSSYGSSSSYNEYCVPRGNAMVRGDTTTDLSRLWESLGRWPAQCLIQRRSRAVEVWEEWQHNNQVSLLSNFVILI